MLILVDGPAGSGKTFFSVRLARRQWKKGTRIFPNFPVWFDEDRTNIFRWYALDETYNLNKGVLLIDESAILLDARRWAQLPYTFTEKIAMHRHHHLDIITTAQDFGHIDIRVRTNVHERYTCASMFRFPRNQRKRPILQLIRVHKKVRAYENENQRIKWLRSITRFYFISKYWTKTYYNTYQEAVTPKFLCRIMYQRKNPLGKAKWIGKIYSRDLVNNRKARL